MFFYSVLIVASLITAAVITLLYYLFSSAGTVIYKSVVPCSGKGSICHLKTNLKRTLYSHTSTPKGLVNDDSPGMMAWVSTGQPNATDELNGNKSFYSPQKIYSSQSRAISRKQSVPLLRENKLSDFGKAYKVTRQVTPSENNLRT